MSEQLATEQPLYDRMAAIEQAAMLRVPPEVLAGKPNPRFEAESRTFNQSIPVSAVKEIIVRKGGRSGDAIELSQGVDRNNNPVWAWTDPQGQTLSGPFPTRDAAMKGGIKGIPARFVDSVKELQTDRVRRFYRRANEAGGPK